KCDAVGVVLPDAESNHRIYALDFPDSKGILREEILVPVEDSPAARVLRTGEPLAFDSRDLAQLDPPDRFAVAEGLQTLCLLPLVSRDRVLGILGLGRRQDNPFSREEVDFLVQVSKQIAIAVENALAYRQIAGLKDQLAQEKLYLEDEIRSEMNFDEI